LPGRQAGPDGNHDRDTEGALSGKATTTLVIKGNPTRRGLLEQVRRQAPGLLSEDRDGTMTPAEVAALFRVDPKTVTRWANEGRLTSVRTPGNHRRYREAEVSALLAERDAAGRKYLPPAPEAQGGK
jgi:excisionase family DNA binding protein